jgi:hypothetical protein
MRKVLVACYFSKNPMTERVNIALLLSCKRISESNELRGIAGGFE